MFPQSVVLVQNVALSQKPEVAEHVVPVLSSQQLEAQSVEAVQAEQMAPVPGVGKPGQSQVPVLVLQAMPLQSAEDAHWLMESQ